MGNGRNADPPGSADIDPRQPRGSKISASHTINPRNGSTRPSSDRKVSRSRYTIVIFGRSGSAWSGAPGNCSRSNRKEMGRVGSGGKLPPNASDRKGKNANLGYNHPAARNGSRLCTDATKLRHSLVGSSHRCGGTWKRLVSRVTNQNTSSG